MEEDMGEWVLAMYVGRKVYSMYVVQLVSLQT